MADDLIKRIADRRHSLHEDHRSSRPLSPGYENVGLTGEFAFGQLSGLMPDITDKPKGDGGIDFTVSLKFTVDVKTARKAIHLIHEHGKPMCDIYVLAEYDDTTGNAHLIGWAWGRELARAPVRDFGYGIENHYIHRDQLKPISELQARLHG